PSNRLEDLWRSGFEIVSFIISKLERIIRIVANWTNDDEFKIDGFVKSPIQPIIVIPVKLVLEGINRGTGIQ
ncbi:MAG: hypothetical protein COZ69_07340, partial [Deltaproteobacteria bacterium CG_4_8_14_3_um_filter_45_9]